MAPKWSFTLIKPLLLTQSSTEGRNYWFAKNAAENFVAVVSPPTPEANPN